MLYYCLRDAENENGFSASSKKPKKLIIDTDAGGDDAAAILLALGFEKNSEKSSFEVIAITCTYGNTNLTNVATNVLKILTIAHRSDVSSLSNR